MVPSKEKMEISLRANVCALILVGVIVAVRMFHQETSERPISENLDNTIQCISILTSRVNDAELYLSARSYHV